MIYKKRVIKLPENSHTFLFGVRGSGKTALLNKRFPSPTKSLHIDLLDESLYQSYLSNVAQFYEKISALKKAAVIIVDEIQKMPRLLNEVHRLIEESSRGEAPARQFILTGSSARKLKAPGVNLLAGRAGRTTLHPFIPEELGEDFNLDQALRYGLLPIVWSHHDREIKLKSYAEEYLKEEIQAMALVRNLPSFARFLEVAGLYHGQAVNMSAISRECQTPQKAVRDYFSILEDTLLGFFLPAYTPRLQLRERKHKKFYFIDPGLARTLRKDFGLVSHAEKGPLFEGLVAQILRAYRDYYSLFEEMYYWSPVDSKKTEVDFLLKRGKELIAIEVKARTQVSSSEYKGLKAIQQLPSVKKRILVYMGEFIGKTEEGIDIWPFDFFCQNLQEGNFNAPVVYTKKSKKKTELSLAIPSSNRMFTLKELQIPPDDEKQFEELCLDLYRKEFGESTQLHGRRGQRQQGVDIFSQYKLEDGSIVNIGVQCKKRDHYKGKITEKELIEEVEKAKNFKLDPKKPTSSLNRFILATTCKRDEKIQKTAWRLTQKHKKGKLFSVEIHSWDEIKKLLDKHLEVYHKYCRIKTDLNKENFASKINLLISNNISLDTIKEIKSESYHAELERIQNLLPTKPKTALNLLENFKDKEWDKLNDKIKYKVLICMSVAKTRMNAEKADKDLPIQALQYNKEDENALMNCAFAYWMKNDIEKSKEYLKKTRERNPQKIEAYHLEIQIQYKEGKNIKKIVASLPEDIKNKAQIAQLLAQLSIDQEDYKSAEKWLEIFYNNRDKGKSGEWKKIKDEISYADMSLKLILERQEIILSRRIPENLKPHLNKIIDIYKKLTVDKNFNELREFNPIWHLHYALALEINGELKSAIKVLETGVESFPIDGVLKIELSRLFVQTGNITKAIEILETHLKKQPTTISKKSLDSNQENIEEQSFRIILILTDLYFQNKQEDKAQKLLDDIEKSPSMREDLKLDVMQYRIDKFIQFGKIKEAEKKLIPLFEKDKKNIMNLILKSNIEKAKACEDKTEDFKSQKEKSIQHLKKAVDIVEEEDQLSPYYENKSRRWLINIQRLIRELYISKMYGEVLPLLEKTTKRNLNHEDIFKLLQVYFENGQNQKAIKLAKDLRQIFPKDILPVNILCDIYEDLGDRKGVIKCYEDFIKHNPENSQIKVELALVYIRNEQLDKAKTLLSKSIDFKKLSVNEIGRLALAYSHTSQLEKALYILYQSIKKYPANRDLQQIYSDLIIFRTKKDHQFLSPPQKSDIDCYLKIKELESQEITEMIIEKPEDIYIPDANIYTPDHPFAKKFLNKSVKSIIHHEHKQYEILEIENKYVYKYHEIIKNAEKRFPTKPFIKKAVTPKSATKEDIFKTLKQFIPDIREEQKKIFQYYAQGKLPIGSLSRMTGQHPIEAINSLCRQSSNQKFISSLVDLKNYANLKDYAVLKDYEFLQEDLNQKKELIIDLSSLYILHSIKMEKYFEESHFKLYICLSTIESIKEMIQKMKLHSKDGLLTAGFDNQDKLTTSYIPAKNVQEYLNFLENILKWTKEVCSIKTVPVDYIQSRHKKLFIENVIRKEFLDPLISSHNNKNTVLLSEDGVIGTLSTNEFNVFRVRLWDIIQYFKKHLIISKHQAMQFTAELIRQNQVYIPVNHELLLFLLKEAKYSITDIGFQRGLYFMGSISNLHQVIEVLSRFLIELFQEPALLLHHKELITQEALNKACVGRTYITASDIAIRLKQSIQLRTILLPLQQKEIENSINYWLKNKIY